MKNIFLVVISIINFCSVAVAQKSTDFSILKTFSIASAGGWDYIQQNPENNLLYISHGTQVNIINKNNGDSVGIIEKTTGVHGIAFDPIRHLGFTSNGRLNNVTVFKVETNEVLMQIPTGKNPDAIAYEPYSKTIITCNGQSNDLTVIDPATLSVSHIISLGGRPETAVSDGNGFFYINLEDKSEITVLDTRTFKIVNTWSLAPGEGPAGLAVDEKTHRLFAGCDKLLVIMNADDGKIVDKIPIGAGCDGVAFDESTQEIFTSNGEGTITVIKEKNKDHFFLEGNIITKRGARTIVNDPKKHVLYLPVAEYEAQAANEKGRPKVKPGTFQVLMVGRK